MRKVFHRFGFHLLLSGLLILQGFTPLFAQNPQPVIPIPYSQPGSTYQQSFNSLPNSGTFLLNGKGPFNLSDQPINASLQGWQILQVAGSGANLSFLPGTGSGTGSGIYSFGNSGNNDRSIGTLASGTGVFAFGLILTNQSGMLLNSVTISYTACQWRKGGSGNRNTWQFKYATGNFQHIDQNGLLTDSSCNFRSIQTSIGAATLNGNLPINQQSISATINGLQWENGQQLLLRWDDADETGSDDAMAIDQFQFSAVRLASSPTIQNTLIKNISSTSAQIESIIADNFSATTIYVEMDTAVLFPNPLKIYPTDSILASGTGTTTVQTILSQLIPATQYHIRTIAKNHIGKTTSTTTTFTTLATTPILETFAPKNITQNSSVLGGKLLHAGGAAITEKGIVWSQLPLPTVANNKISISGNDSSFEKSIGTLPAGTKLFVRAYGINSAGTGYGNEINWYTKTTLTSIKLLSPFVTNLDTALLELNFAQSIQFPAVDLGSLQKKTDSDARLLGITGSANKYLIQILTGSTDTELQFTLDHDKGSIPGIHNLPFAGPIMKVDKTPPNILGIRFPERLYKLGDTIVTTIQTKADTGHYAMISGILDQYPLKGWGKVNDSTYKAWVVVQTGGITRIEGDTIICKIELKDFCGNKNAQSSYGWKLLNTRIDGNIPTISSLLTPPKKIYKSGDTLLFRLVFTEPINCDTTLGLPTLPVTIGTRIRDCAYLPTGSPNSLAFRYIIQPDESDMDGVRVATDLTSNNSTITDAAGNTASLKIPNSGIINGILIDGVAPVITAVATPPAKTYMPGDTLSLLVQFSETTYQISDTTIPFIPVTIGNSLKQFRYAGGSGTNQFRFTYRIQPNENDKNGLSISNLIVDPLFTCKDLAGNPIIPVLKNVGALSNVLIDGIAPYFVEAGTNEKYVCSNVQRYPIQALLKVIDEEYNETIRWSLVKEPNYGRIDGLPFTMKSGSDTLQPTTANYAPFNNFTGIDSITVSIGDGVHAQLKTIVFNVHEMIGTNRLSADQYICKGYGAGLITGSTPTGGNNLYTINWIGSTDSLNYTLIQNANQNNFDPGNLLSTTWFKRVVISGGCIDSTTSTKITVIQKGLWMGNHSTNWESGSNWCGGLVPDQNTDVWILNEKPIVISSSSISTCKNAYLTDKSLLHINGMLDIYGNILGNGKIDATNGTIVWSNPNDTNFPVQHFKDAQIHSLAINNPGKTALNDALSIAHQLSLHKGQFITNNKLELLENAFIGPSAQGTQMAGSLSVNRKFSLKKTNTHFITHPFMSNQGIGILQPQLKLSGIGGAMNGFDSTSESHPSAHRFQWKEMALTDLGTAWTPYTNTNGLDSNAWKPFQGIRVNMTPKKNKMDSLIPNHSGNEELVIKLNGTVNMGDQTLLLPATTDTTWELIGNPYLATIDLRHLSRDETIGHYGWIWDTEMAQHGAFRAIPFYSHFPVPPLSVFFIKLYPGEEHSIYFSEQGKSPLAIPDSLTGYVDNCYQIELSLEQDSIVYDKTLLLFIDSSRNRLDRMDAEKLMNPEVNLYSISSDGYQLSADARPLNKRTTIPLGITQKEKGIFRLVINRCLLPLGTDLYLVDKYLAKETIIQQDSSYTFTITNDTASFGEHRFEIRGPLPPPPPIEPLVIKLYPVPAKEILHFNYTSRDTGYTTAIIRNSSGIALRKQSFGISNSGNLSIALNGLIGGVYFLELHCGKYVIAQAFIKQ